MTSKAPSKPPGKPKRHLKNYLLDPRFQLKYTGMVVAVTVVVASVLGTFAYRESKEQTASLNIQLMSSPDLDPAVTQSILDHSKDKDRETLLAIIGGIAFLAFALGFTGIIVTHKLVGPAYKLQLLLKEVASGKLKLVGRLRKGDELQDVFEAFAEMIEALRASQAREIAELDTAIAHATEAGVPAAELDAIAAVRDRMQASLD